MNTTTVQTVTFGRGGNSEIFQRSGWSDPEPGYTWSVGPESTLTLPALNAPSGFWIELTCAIFQPLPVEIHVNDQPVASCRIEGQGTFMWRAPPVHGRLAVRLAFRHPEARRPSDMTGSTDGRALGLQCQRLRLLCLNEVEGAPRAGGTGESPSDADLVWEFASLGDDCELGLVQRALGAEPLGLLRFSTAHLPHVLQGIEAEWAGLGDQLAVAVENGEWMTREHGYKLRWHTFFQPHEITADALLIKERKKTAFLRRRLIEEVANSDRIFVAKARDEPASKEQIMALHVALNRIAPNWLLWVTADGEPGTVELVAPRLMRGHVSRFTRAGLANDYVLDDWIAILHAAHRLARGPQPRPAPMPLSSPAGLAS